MRPEKKLFLAATERYLDKYQYLFLLEYRTMTMEETAELRSVLREQEAEYHVIKNSNFKIAIDKHNVPEVWQFLKGQTALVIGRKNPSDVARMLTAFNKSKQKASVKCGVFQGRFLSRQEVIDLSELPSLPEMQSRFLNLLNGSAHQILRIMQAIPEGLLNVLQAHTKTLTEIQ